MKKAIVVIVLLLAPIYSVLAESTWGMNPVKLQLAPMNPLAEAAIYEPLDYEVNEADVMDQSLAFDVDIFKQKTNPGLKKYKVLDDLTFVGVPVFLAGIIAKPQKSSFRQNYNNTHSNTRLITNFKSEIDNNFSWRLFADYDYARKTYTLTYDPYRFLKTAVPNLVSFYESYGSSLDPDIFEKKKSNYFFTLGASFAVNF